MALFLDFSIFFLKTSFSFFLPFLKRRMREEDVLFSHFFSPFLKKKKKGKGRRERERIFALLGKFLLSYDKKNAETP